MRMLILVHSYLKKSHVTRVTSEEQPLIIRKNLSHRAWLLCVHQKAFYRRRPTTLSCKLSLTTWRKIFTKPILQDAIVTINSFYALTKKKLILQRHHSFFFALVKTLHYARNYNQKSHFDSCPFFLKQKNKNTKRPKPKFKTLPIPLVTRLTSTIHQELCTCSEIMFRRVTTVSQLPYNYTSTRQC